jgi:hypothetical protein
MSNAFDQIFSNTNAKMETPPVIGQPNPIAPKIPKTEPKKALKTTSITKLPDNSNTQVLNKPIQKTLEIQEPEPEYEYIKKLKKVKKIPVTLGKGKTFFFEPDMMEFFKFVKFKKKLDESLYARQVFEKAFCEEFGDNWRDMLN